MSSRKEIEISSFAWRSAPDWIQVGIAVVLLVAAIVSPNQGNSYFSSGWGIALSLALAATALWALSQTTPTASIAQGVVGLIVFVMPWLGGAHGGWAWFGWLGGILIILVAAWSYFSMPTSAAKN